MTEQSGTFQSAVSKEGSTYYMIDGEEFFVPAYVVKFVTAMSNPIKPGERVSFTTAVNEQGLKRITKIWRHKKEPQDNQRSGILISHFATGCTIQVGNDRKNYALQSGFPEVELPQKIEFTVDKNGFIKTYSFHGKADSNEIANPPEKGSKTITQNNSVPESARQTSQQEEKGEDRSYWWDLTIGGTINLGNYENLKIEISGPVCDREKLIACLNETAGLFGRNNPAVKDMIDTWCKRVLGGN